MANKAQILIYDPKGVFEEALGPFLESISAEAHFRSMFASVRQFLTRRQADICLLVLDSLSEKQLNELSKSLLESAELILLSEQPRPDLAEKCAHLGASYYFCKPIDFAYFKEVMCDILNDIESSSGTGEPTQVQMPLDKFGLIYGNAHVMRRMYRKIRKVADSRISVLLTGESGTGKELAARTVHMLSPRRDQPYLSLNCSAVPQNLLESELFGHKRGSFTGAVRDHAGYFERAEGGTLFLDEVTEMDLHLQSKLLRVLESSMYTPVGGTREQEADVRIVAATNRVPHEAVKADQLREDLFFRLAQFPIRVPPLRERGEDIVKLAQLFLLQLNQEHQTNKHFSDELLERISSYRWPGNVRELRHNVEHAYVLGLEEIKIADLPTYILQDDPFPESSQSLQLPTNLPLYEAEKRYILAGLDLFDGDKQKTASSLGISLKTLYNKLNRYAEEEAEGEATPAES